MICKFEDLLKIVKGNFVCKLNEKSISKGEIDTGNYQNYKVISIEIEEGTIQIELKPFEFVTPEFNSNDDWVKEHKKQFESELSFF